MGKPFRVEAVLPENARTYFLERDSAAFRALLAKVLKLGTVEMTDTWRQGESTFVRLVTRPDFANWVPKGVQGQANSKAIEFHDVIEYNPALIQRPPFQINVKTESPFLGDKLDVQLELLIEEVDESSCRQVLQGTIRVSMFGVGRIVESIVKDSLINTYKKLPQILQFGGRKLPEIVRRWQAFRAEALANGNARELLSGRPPVGHAIGWIRAEVLQIMQSPIEAEAVFPPPSPTAVVSPDDLSQFSTDEQAERAGPAAAAASREEHAAEAAGVAAAAAAAREEAAEAAGAAAAAAAAREEHAAEAAGAAATAAGSPAGEPTSAAAGAAAGAAQPMEGAQSWGQPLEQSTATVYYDANDLLEEDSVTSALAPGDRSRGRQQQKQQQQQQQRGRLKQAPSLTVEIPQPYGEYSGELRAVESAGGAPPRHRRNISIESADSNAEMALYGAGGDGGGTSSPFQKRPTSQRSWRGFNDKYEQWTTYWDAMGVKHMAPREPPSGPLAFLYRAQSTLSTSASTLMMTVYLFAMRKGLINVEPNEDGRYVGKAPRLDLHDHPSPSPAETPSSPAPLHRPLLRHMSAPLVQQGEEGLPRRQQQQHQEEEEDAAGAEGSVALPGAGQGAGGSAVGRELSAVSQYGSTAQAAALLEGYTHRRISGHRRAVSVDTGTAAAARQLAAAEACGRSTHQQQQQQQSQGLGQLGCGQQQQGERGAPAPKRRSTAIPLAALPGQAEGGECLEDERIYPPARFSCLPACWHGSCRRPKHSSSSGGSPCMKEGSTRR